MANETFTGTIQVTDAASNVTIQLRGNDGDIVAGGKGQTGGLYLLGPDPNQWRIQMTAGPDATITVGGDGEGGKVRILDANDQAALELGKNGSLSIGVTGNAGKLVVHDNAGQEVFRFDGTQAELYVGTQGNEGDVIVRDQYNNERIKLWGGTGVIRVRSATGKDLLLFDSASAALYVGGQDNEGDVIVRDQDNKARIKLDGGEGDLWVRSAAGKDLLLFDSTYAALYVGGQGNEGDIIVRDQDNKERIKLDAGEGDLWVRSAAGKDLLLFDSTYAALYVGGQDNEGDVIVRDQDKIERIKLDGGQGRIYVRNGAGVETIRCDGGSGDIMLSNADCAEEFDLATNADAEPGTVMVLHEDGELQTSSEPYDKRVAGVVSGAGDYRPGIVFDRRDSGRSRAAIALVGKAYCKADSQYEAIKVGDLLTTSPTPGHAMKASDTVKAFGAVIGKALRPLESGVGLIPILITLQ